MSAAPAAKAARVPPSTFSALLRRSKFASYDPKIGQIYATYDGSAARGDWGLKRPLALRRRDARLAIHNVDTIYQQTEWTSAYTDTEWVRKFNELGVVPRVANGTWAQKFPSEDKQWLHDSEFNGEERPKVNEDYLASFSPAPNTTAMSAKRFERYLRKVRRQRQDFQAFIKTKKDVIHDGTVDSLLSPTRPKELIYKAVYKESRDRHVQTFLAKEFAQNSASNNSDIVQSIPHPTGGLTYANASDYQSRYRSKPVPGRALHLVPKKDNTSSLHVNVAVGGWVGREIAVKNDLDFTLTDFGTLEGAPRKNERNGEGIYRPLQAMLHKPPEVVGRHPQRVEKSELSLQFVNWKGVEEVQRNPYTPGSREYVAHLNISKREARRGGGRATPAPMYRPIKTGTMLTVPKSAKPKVQAQQRSALIERLQNSIHAPSPSDEDLANSS